MDVKRGVVVEQDVDDGRNGNRHRDSKDVAYVARGWDSPRTEIENLSLSSFAHCDERNREHKMPSSGAS